MIKDTLTPYQTLNSDAWDSAYELKPNIIMGHNRAATRGVVNKDNAHPFTCEHVTLMHNGTLDTHLSHSKIRTGTDSESVCIHLAEQGVESMWSNLDGAAALVWFDEKANSLNFLRNLQRPLVFLFTEDEKNLIWASEEWMIDRAVTYWGLKNVNKTSMRPNADAHLSFTQSGNGKIQCGTEILKPCTKPIYNNYGFTATKGTLIGGGKNPFPKGGGGKKLTSNSTGDRGTKTIDIPHRTFPTYLSVEKFLTDYTHCGLCFSPLDEAEHGNCTIIDEQVAVCTDCSNVAELHDITVTPLFISNCK